MPVVEFSELPDKIRIKLSEKGKKQLWHRINEFGGIKDLAEAFDYSSSKMYNWKNKDLALPLDFVQQIMGENNTEEIVLLKGTGSSGKIIDPEFPLHISEELLTRIEKSVTENSEGTPVYITSEKSLQERFTKLLNEPGKVEYKSYTRQSRYEVRYPKFLQEIFSEITFEEDLTALVDETSKIEDGKITLENREISVEDFDQHLFSREKKFDIALERGDSEKIAKLMAEESEKVKGLIN